VFDHLVAGRSNKKIAARIGISPRTVEFHRAHIMEKTAAKGLPDLVRLSLGARLPQSAK
jgi:FixJ family two-component response regulator